MTPARASRIRTLCLVRLCCYTTSCALAPLAQKTNGSNHAWAAFYDKVANKGPFPPAPQNIPRRFATRAWNRSLRHSSVTSGGQETTHGGSGHNHVDQIALPRPQPRWKAREHVSVRCFAQILIEIWGQKGGRYCIPQNFGTLQLNTFVMGVPMWLVIVDSFQVTVVAGTLAGSLAATFMATWLLVMPAACFQDFYLESQIAQNNRPLHRKEAHNLLNATHIYKPRAFWVGAQPSFKSCYDVDALLFPRMA